MKTFSKSHVNNSNCSCSTCLYNSESNNPSVQSFLAKGSRIDRLYYGKYIPLREQKLLERLVRTRAVYNDLRAQLLSDSTVSVNKQPGAHNVNGLVAKNISECCSCCSCSSRINLGSQHLLPTRHKHHYNGIYKQVRQRNGRFHRDYHDREKGVRFKAKRIRSDPCACLLKYSGLIKNISKTMLRKHRMSSPLPAPHLQPMIYENEQNANVIQTSLQNMRQYKRRVTEVMLEGIKKLNDSKTKIQENIEVNAKKSIDKLKDTKHKLESKRKSGKKSKKQTTLETKKKDSICACPETGLVSQIKKDSLVKFKDGLKKKQTMKDLECKHECSEAICDPESCYLKLTRRESLNMKPHHARKQKLNKHTVNTENILKHTKKSQMPGREPNDEISNIYSVSKQSSDKSAKQRGVRGRKQGKHQKPKEMRKKNKILSFELAQENGSRQAVRISSSFSFNIDFSKNRSTPRKEMRRKKSKLSHSVKRNLNLKYKNHSSQKITKQKRNVKTIDSLKKCLCKKVKEKSTVPDNSLTDLKVSQLKHINTNTESNRLEINKSKKNFYATEQLMPYECEPVICTPGYCDPQLCLKVINMRKNKVRSRSVKCYCSSSDSNARKNKSTSSLASKYAPREAKHVQSVIAFTRRPKNAEMLVQKPIDRRQIINRKNDNRQLVRIGSTFSFSVEFYKDRPNKSPDTRKLAFNPKPETARKQKLRTKEIQRNKDNKIKETQHNITYNKQTKETAIKRCFCTLKLQGNKYKRNKKRMLSTGTETVNKTYFDAITLNRSTKMDQKYFPLLEPFECEPFVCVPGECDPYVCLERIQTRHKLLKDASVTTRQTLSEIGSNTRSVIASKYIQAHTIPKSKHRKIFTKRKTGNIRNLNHKETTDSLKEKQSVTIGSSFNFNIEFSKSKLPLASPVSEENRNRRRQLSSSNKLLNKNTQDFKKAVHQETFFEYNKKLHKASMIRPLLKRCFCTLNLQKNLKQRSLKSITPKKIKNMHLTPQVYTVHKLFTNQTSSNSSMTKTSRSVENGKNNENNTFYVFSSASQIWEAIKISSNLSRVTDFSKAISEYSLGNSFVISNQEQNHKFLFKNSYNCVKDKSLIPISEQVLPNLQTQNYKSSFCAMNLHINNKYKYKKYPYRVFKNTNMNKFGFGDKMNSVLPYECEPGVCVPGSCDPNECQQLILKRNLRKKLTKKSSTSHTISKAAYINTNPNIHMHSTTETKKEITLKAIPFKSPEIDRRVVRIGSSFSFDIEFSKNGSMADSSLYNKILKLKNKPSKSFDTSELGMKKLNYHNVQSQSALNKADHKASVTVPIIRRCFCTLKLQKKGKLNKKFQQTDLVFDKNVIQMKTASQNTKKTKPLKLTPMLLPYECEPNICDPDNCDPYRCLEIMKRKTRNIETESSNIDPLLYKNEYVDSNFLRNKSKASQIKQKKSTTKSQLKLIKRDENSSSIHPSKQIVRIGSNISFNIELFKDRTPSYTDQRVLDDERVSYLKRKHFLESKEKSRSVETPLRKPQKIKHKNIQMQNTSQIGSTMTSFAKRCFCITTLNPSNKGYVGKNLQRNERSSFVKKCLCWLKSKSPNTEILPKNKKKTLHANKRTVTGTNLSHHAHSIKHCECKPEVCPSKSCNPYVCYKTKKNLINRPVKSVSHPTRTYVTNNLMKNIKTQENTEISKGSSLRIGSKCSFDIQFSKSKTPENKNNTNVYKPRRNYVTDKHKKVMKQDEISISSRLTQTAHPDLRNFGVNNKIKRCFCTLQLNNKIKKPNNVIKEKSKSIMTEKVKSPNRPLLPYECEPNICIPYHCDPYECDEIMRHRRQKKSSSNILPYECEPLTCIPGKCNPVECLQRIQRRQYRTKKLGSTAPRMYTSSTITKNNSKFKNRTNQSKILYQSLMPNKSTMNKNVLNSNKQTVRIGSKLSFAIEFYKNNIPNTLHTADINNNETGIQRQTIKIQQKPPKNLNRNSNDSFMPRRRSIATESIHYKYKNKKSDVNPFLKRCFCVLKLKRNKIKQKPIPKTFESNMKNNTYTKMKKQQTLLPYECEPNVCIPGQCNPYECEKRIKKRLLNEFSQNPDSISRLTKQSGPKTGETKSVKLQVIQAPIQRPRLKRHSVKCEEKYEGENVCGIRSDFSISIEFSKGGHKDTILNEKNIDNDRNNQKIKKSSNIPPLRDNTLQTEARMKKSNSSSVTSPLKRCFCTLKLQKPPLKSLKTSSQDFQKRAIKKKLAQRSVKSNVVPENINISLPYSFKDHNKRKSQDSQVEKLCASKCIGIKPRNLERKLQTQHLNNTGYRKNIVEVPRFSNPFNKQSVRISSNFSFQIELYKHRLPDMTSYNFDKRIQENNHKDYAANSFYSENNTQAKRKDKSLEAKNVLKRCFCTLKLQNMKSKPVKQSVLNLTKTPYPQVLEVRRVAVQKKIKKVLQQTSPPIRTTAAQSKNNNKKENMKKCKCETVNEEGIKTILPYTPNKFKKSKSITLLPGNDYELLPPAKSDHIKETESKLKGKKLTRKKSRGEINFVKHQELYPDKKCTVFKTLCHCVRLSSTKKYIHEKQHKNEESIPNNNLPNKSNFKSHKTRFHSSQYFAKPKRQPKKLKNEEHRIGHQLPQCHEDCRIQNRHFVQQNDNKIKKVRQKKKNEVTKINLNNKSARNNERPSTNDNVYHLISDRTLCSICNKSVNIIDGKNRKNDKSSRPKVHFLEPSIASQINFGDMKSNKNRKRITKSTKPRRLDSDQKECCHSCGRLIDAQEIHKAAGDYIKNNNTVNNTNHELFFDKIKRLVRNKIINKMCRLDNKSKTTINPLFEVLLSSDDYAVINKEVVRNNITKINTRTNKNKLVHRKSCPCRLCVCGNDLSVSKSRAKDSNKLTSKPQQKKKKKSEPEKKLRKSHLEKLLKEHEISNRKRQKIHKGMYKKINKNSSDLVLFAESVIDIGTLGVTSAAGILRGVVRSSFDPKKTLRNLKGLKENPSLISRYLKVGFNSSGAAATARRIRLRCLSMRGVKKLKEVLESYRITHYLLHVADKDPKKRIFKEKKKVRERERLDFGCSLYMASFRKRKYISMYDRFPLLYPHFLSLINVYKQLRDMMLFLIAVVVWSPCILCMEMSRALTCCIFCTG